MLPAARPRLTLLAALVLVTACDGLPSLPPAPSELSRGVTIFEHANFLGESAYLESSEEDLEEFDGPCEHETTDGNGSSGTTHDWNDCISSIRVAPGWRAIVYRDDDYKGQSIEITAEAPNLQLVQGSCDHEGLNDCVTSIKVIAPGMPF